MRIAAFALAVVSLVPLAASCVGTTGSDLLTFNAAAAGPTAVVEGQPYTFTNGRGYAVTLTKAVLHVGGVYLNMARPESGAQSTDCVLPGVYVAEVAGTGLEVNLLSASPQPFPNKGEATETPAVIGEIWLTHGDVNDPGDSSPILTVEGTASQNGQSYPFQGSVSIGANKLQPVTDPSQPSAHPICKERIVTGIEASITPKNGGSLLLRIDPQGFFTNVNFSQLTKVSDSPLLYQFDDSLSGQPNKNIYLGLHANSGVYEFQWVNSSTP
jgi:hypothetical protein